MLDENTIIQEGDVVTIRATVQRLFPHSDAMAVTPIIPLRMAALDRLERVTSFLVTRAELSTHEPKAAEVGPRY